MTRPIFLFLSGEEQNFYSTGLQGQRNLEKSISVSTRFEVNSMLVNSSTTKVHLVVVKKKVIRRSDFLYLDI